MFPFLDRRAELERLDGLLRGRDGALAVVHGRRRLGKTRLLVEWARRHGGLYTVADQSAAPIQRRYLAEAVAARLKGFADVEYPDWPRLLGRLTREAGAVGLRGPIILDEFPYLALASPELPSVLQRWLDHAAGPAGLVVVVAGSSQRMMHGLALAAEAPLFGRAREILQIRPLPPAFLLEALGLARAAQVVEPCAAWGGVPRYWELAAALSGGTVERIDRLVLDPLGPLHREPDRLLLEELPPAIELRPLLDAIGAGASRVSELAARVGSKATSLSRPLSRLVDMGLVRRETPFGEPERSTKRSLYRLDDPLFRLWFRVVAPNRARLADASAAGRRELLLRHWPQLVAVAWEDLCRSGIPRVPPRSALGRAGPWGPAQRWWHGQAPEWGLVSESSDGRRLLLGEARWSARPVAERDLRRALDELARRPPPSLGREHAGKEIVRALFVPEAAVPLRRVPGALVVTAEDLIRRE